MAVEHDSLLEILAARAIEAGADTLEIEYDEGYEDVYARSGNFARTIARLPSSSKEAAALRKELFGMGKRSRSIEVDEVQYSLRCERYDSFGETAFRVELRRVKRELRS